MTRPRLRRAAAATPLLFLVALPLAGCGGAAPAPSDTQEPSPTSAASPSVTPDATPEEAPDAPPSAAATCDDVMTDEAYAKLMADGLEPRESTTLDPVAEQIADAGGLTCSWGKPQTDILLDVRQAVTGSDEASWASALTVAGYVNTEDPVAGAWTGPVEGGSGLSPVVVLADGTVTFVSSPTFAPWIRPAS